MEYAKDIILNIGYRGLRGFKHKTIEKTAKIENIKKILSKVVSGVKNWTSSIIRIIRNNKIICLSLGMLIILISADIILIDNFMKIFSTLY